MVLEFKKNNMQRVQQIVAILEVKTYSFLIGKGEHKIICKMEIQIKSYLSAHFSSVLCILLTPLLHGLRENGLELNYDVVDLRNAVLVEFIVIVVDAWDEVVLSTLRGIFSSVSLLALVAEVGLGWTLDPLMTSFAVHLGIRSLLLEIITLVKNSVKNSFLLWFSNITCLQRRLYILSRITRILLLCILTVCILVMKVTIIPKLFIPNSPILVRPDNPIKAIQWTSDIGNEITLNAETPEFKTNHLARVSGEDAQMNCRISREFNPSGSHLKIIWRLNGKTVREDKRHKSMSFRHKNYTIFQLMLIEIRRSDFGEYKCYLQAIPLNSDDEGNRIRLIEIRRIYLVERIETSLSVNAALGAAVNIENVFIFNFIRNETNHGQNEANWIYTINDVNFSNACPVEEDSKRLWTGDYKSINYPVPNCVYKAAEYRCNFSLVVCSEAYGLHEFAVLKTTNVGNTTVTQLPIKVNLFPEKTILSNQDDYVIYDHLDTDFRKDPTNKQEVRLLQMLRAKETSETRKVEAWAKVIIFLVAAFVPCFIGVVDIVFNILETIILIGIRKTEYRLGFPPRQKKLKNKYKYDVFMSFCDADRKFAYKKLLPLLREKHGLKVCVPDADMRHGHTLWSEYYECISRSKKVIVLASENYLRDHICNNMQFSMLIIPMLYDRDKSYDDIFILKYGPCNIPGIYYHFLTISHWDEYKNLDVLAKGIKMWMSKSCMASNNVFFDILFQVFTILEGM